MTSSGPDVTLLPAAMTYVVHVSSATLKARHCWVRTHPRAHANSGSCDWCRSTSVSTRTKFAMTTPSSTLRKTFRPRGSVDFGESGEIWRRQYLNNNNSNTITDYYHYPKQFITIAMTVRLLKSS